jgi:C-terminal processing protease CtpA/Prc
MRNLVRPVWRWLIPLALPLFAPEYAKLNDGEDVSVAEEPAAQPMRQPRFTGPTALLIGEGTFSSAMMLADAVRTYDLMSTIGEPTGGIPTSLGELGFVELPSSRIIVQFCQKKFLRASGDPHEAGPVVPHIEVKPEPGRDAVMERAIAELRSASATS